MVVTECDGVVTFRMSRGGFVNYCYSVIGRRTGTCVLVDPAWNRPALDEYFAESALTPAAVLVTHHHHDHLDLAQELALEYRCPIYMSEVEYNYYALRLERVALVRDLERIAVGGLSIMPIMTPGHTTGSVCFQVAGALFTGDTLFNEGCGVCVGDGASALQLFFSLQRLKALLPAQTRIFPGHRFHSDLGRVFAEIEGMNPYLHFADARDFVRFRMRKAQARLTAFL